MLNGDFCAEYPQGKSEESLLNELYLTNLIAKSDLQIGVRGRLRVRIFRTEHAL